MELKPCVKCGNVVNGHVNYYGLNNFRFEVECTHCNHVWLSRRFDSLMKANVNGAKSYNGMPRKQRKNRKR